MEKIFVTIGSLVMFVAVALGAFGAHGLRSHFESNPGLLGNWETAVRYQMVHGLAILVVAWAATRWPGRWVKWSGYLFLLAVLVFSGSLYLLSLTGRSWLGAIAPIGGAAFLAGWVCLLVVVWRE